MAETYKVGQYRYTGDMGDDNDPCLQPLNTYPSESNENNSTIDDSGWLEPVYRNANFKIGDEVEGSNCCYQDVLIPLLGKDREEDFTFSRNDVYCIELNIAQMETPVSYTLKLVNKDDKKTGFQQFEVLKRFSVSNYSDSNCIPVKVVLYSNNNSQEKNSFRLAVLDESGNNFGCSPLPSNWNTINCKNQVEILPSWIFDIAEDKKEFYSTFISSNYYEDIFDSLLLEIERTADEKDIITSLNSPISSLDGEHTYNYILGHWLNVSEPDPSKPDHLDIKLYKINKILPRQNEIIKKIGIWGRPGLAMAINGQRIEIGPSGVFEFEGLDITSFGVFAEGIKDKFVVDYQYVVTQ